MTGQRETRAQRDARIIAETVAATLAAIRAERAAERAERAASPRAESPSQTMFRTRTAGTCPSCGRADFRTVKGALGHLTTPSGDACARTPERDAGILAQHPEAPTAAQ